MQTQSVRRIVLILAVFIAITFCFIDASAQRRKRRTRRVARPVITNPVIKPPSSQQTPTTGGEKIISTADENTDPTADGDETAQSAETTKKAKPAAKQASDDEDMQQTINALSNQVNRLTDKLSQMQENERSLLDMERLTRAEQRAESLRSQQVEVESKLADLQSRLEGIEYSLKPENIERAQATFGSTRPEEARETRRRQLESERSRVQAQIKILETSKVRLETAVTTADAEVDLLRRRLESRRAQEESSTAPRTETRPSSNRKRP